VGCCPCCTPLTGRCFPPPSIYAHPGALLYIPLVGLFGAGIGLGIGLAEGLILGLPLAAALGTFEDSRESGGVRREPAVGGPAWERWRWAPSSCSKLTRSNQEVRNLTTKTT